LQEKHWLVGGDEEVGGEQVEGLSGAGIGRWVEVTGDEGEGGVDPEDGKDASEAVIEEDAGVVWACEFSGCDRGDDDAADDEEEIDAEGAVVEEAKVVGGAEFVFDAVKVREDDEEGGESATDLDADDSSGWIFGHV
jgi:hypothetical protein